jgi:hypothetical protein
MPTTILHNEIVEQARARRFAEEAPSAADLAEHNAAVFAEQMITTGNAPSAMLRPLPDDMTGTVCVLRPTALGKRWQLAKFQLVFISGGFGCKVASLGSKVFGHHLADDEDCQFTRQDFIGQATAELIEACMADTRSELPIDPTETCYMAIGTGMTYAKRETIGEAKAAVKRLGGKTVVVFKCHPETYINDMASLTWPRAVPEPVEVWKSKGYK